MFETIGNAYLWGGFAIFVLLAMTIDLVILGRRKGQSVTTKEAAVWSILWIVLSFVFAALLWIYLDGSVGREITRARQRPRAD